MRRITTKCQFTRLLAGLVFLTFAHNQNGIVHANPRIILMPGSQRHVQSMAKASFELRGGSSSSGFGRRPATTSKNPLLSSTQQNSFPSVTVDEEKDEATAKEMINAFLTRESRTTFIGTTSQLMAFGVFKDSPHVPQCSSRLCNSGRSAACYRHVSGSLRNSASATKVDIWW